jgi:NAD-dependent DNA ligase
MNKIKPMIDNIKFSSWINKYKPPYNISDKLDGVSALLIYNNNKIQMLTRGDGYIGMDITHLIKYLSNIPDYNTILNFCNKNKIKGEKNLIAFRGELVIKKDIFINKWNNKFKDCRSLVTSVVNSKKINIDLIRDIDLVLYEIIDPNFTIEKQFKIIKNINNFNLVYNNIYDNIINFEYLSNYLQNRKKNLFIKLME